MTGLALTVFWDEMKIIPSDDDGVGHLSCGDDSAGQDATADRDVSGEWAFLICCGQVQKRIVS